MGIGAAIGSSLGTLIALTTGNWVWMPVMISVNLAAGAMIATWRTSHTAPD